MSERTRGVLQILISGVGFGFLGIFGKMAYEAGLKPGELLALRFLFASVILGSGVALTRPSLLRVSRRELLVASLLGVFGYAVFSSCYFEALQGLSASLTVLLLYAYPAIVSLGAHFWFHERLEKKDWIAVPSVMLGLLLLLWGEISVKSWIYVCFGLGSAVFYSVYILASGHFLKRTPFLSGAFYIQLSAGLALSLVHIRTPGRAWQLSQAAFVPVLGTALFGTVLAVTLFLAGIQKLKKSEASVLSTAEPVTAIIAASLILGERLSVVQLIGGMAVLGTLVLVSLPQKHSNSGITTLGKTNPPSVEPSQN